MNAKVSVIIPNYNYARFIGEAIESVLAQTYQPLEIIVVDDGSTDDSIKVIESFGDKVKLIRQENGGVGKARNTGARNSNGDFLAFLDADDIWLPEKIEKQIAKFDVDTEIGLVHCGMREFNSVTGELIKIHLEGGEGWVATDLLLNEKPVVVGPGGSIVVKRKVYEDVGGFDENLKNGEDWEFCYRVARKCKIGFVAEILVNYRNHNVNAHSNIPQMEHSTLIAWNKSFDTNDKNILRLRRRSFGNLHKILAGSYLQSGQYFDFLRNLLWSLWFRPSFIGYYLSLVMHRKRKNS